MEVDPAQLSAYAVYKKKVQGVKSYEDVKALTPDLASFMQSKSKKKKNKKPAIKIETKAEEKKNNPKQKQGANTPKPVSVPSSPVVNGKKKGSVPNGKAVQNGKHTPVPVKQTNGVPKNKLEPKKQPTKLMNGNGSTPKQQPEATKQSAKQMKGNVSVKKPQSEPIKEQKKKKRDIAAVNGSGPVESEEDLAARKKAKIAKAIPDVIEDLLNSSNKLANSVDIGQKLLAWIIAPTPLAKFMKENWETKPLHVKRKDRDYYKWIHSSAELDKILRNNFIRFGKNIDVTSYVDGERETLNPEGRVMPSILWSYYQDGCSVRFLNPQTYVENLRKLNSYLQEYFGTFVGANSYLTPPDSQGFAPHYDDIEAFIIQLEGKKQWKVYKPRNDSEVLPRFSSPNFSEEKDDLGKPILDVLLEEGDLLYLPRGYIHQARAVDVHSYHLTLSCYQLNSWGDYLKQYLNTAIDQMTASSSEFRKGLPTDYLSYMGQAHASNSAKTAEDKKKRAAFAHQTRVLVTKLIEKVPFDNAADQLGKKFIWDSLPPVLTEVEEALTSAKDGEYMENGTVQNKCGFDTEVEVKLIRQHCVRLVREENALRLYFNVENSLEYHGDEPVFVEVPEETEKALSKLVERYPQFTKISDLPIDDDELKLQLVSDLWERGVLMTRSKLPDAIEDEEDETNDDEETVEESEEDD